MDKARIFTFWEPAENLPAYLKLCMKTWEKFLPEYEIVLLDYKSLDKWLGPDYYDKILYEKFSLPKQADAIRCALLKKYGGIWMDTDTIITSSNLKNIIKTDSDFLILADHIAFIVANKESKIINKWEEGIHKRLHLYKKYYNNKLFRIFVRFKYKAMKRWDYLGNGIIDKYLKQNFSKDFTSVNICDNNIFPELTWNKTENLGKDPILSYKDFYFKNNSLDYFNNNCGIICLHNSWTPAKYKTMSKEEFLNQDITLAKLLRNILENENYEN